MTKKSWWPIWFPYPSAWLNAILLCFFMAGMVVVAREFFWSCLRATIKDENLKLTIFAFGLFLLFPIPAIAVSHHFIHQSLIRLMPNTQISGIENFRNFFPSLVSWWEGICGWAFTAIALLVALMVFSLVYTDWQTLANKSISSGTAETTAGLAWFMTATYLYQIEYLVANRTISTSANRKELMRKET
jgi:hypothetical protein